MYLFNTPKELIGILAERIEKERLSQRISQKDLAERAGMPLSTYKAFVYHTKLSTENMFKLLFALKMNDNIEGLLKPKQYSSIDELKNDTLPQRIRR